MSLELFAGARVRDYRAALAWWSRLLGEPTMHPHDTEAVWELAEGRHLYIVEDERGDGSAVATLFCDDLDERVGKFSARGIEPAERETYDNGVRKVIYRDPEGNELASEARLWADAEVARRSRRASRLPADARP